ncbi:MAG: chemotaxis response regulator protein-glutamate methylesterase [Rhodospirillaceae bacterium]|nr:chemotaxis response regulator protein-glutamate methylesterase [Rhodospirillaceae bacterium]
MVVDDSAVIRGLITRMLESDSDVDVVASVGNGQLAVNSLERNPVDVIILDIEMPVMDGLTALPKLIAVDKSVKIIMASTLTARNAEVSIKALSMGATDYVPKPSTSREISGENDFRRDLLEKVKSLGAMRRHEVGGTVSKRQAPAPSPSATAGAKPAEKSSEIPSKWELRDPSNVKLREAGKMKPDILAIGSSTGGPQALFEFLKGLQKSINIPVVITQHMPATFTTILAEHISRMSGWDCKEAKTGDRLEPGKILLAPGDYHMLIEQKGTDRVVRITQDPPENFCRPAVDPMLRSVVKVFGPRVLTVILTGMGNDGEKGSKVVVDAGGTVISQDEKSSVVWGMPGAVATAGLCSAVLPLNELAGYVMNFIARKG